MADDDRSDYPGAKSDEPSPEQLDFPANWDRLSEQLQHGQSESAEPLLALANDVRNAQAGTEGARDLPKERPAGSTVPVLSLLAASWADLVSLLGFCTACLLAIVAAGYAVALAVLPWIVVAAISWWGAAAAALLVVRRGTPGMLMAGISYATTPPVRRLPAVLIVAALQSFMLGLPSLVGARRAPLRWAGGVELGVAVDQPG